MDSFQALLLALSLIRSHLDDFVASGGKLFLASDSSIEVPLDVVFGSLSKNR